MAYGLNYQPDEKPKETPAKTSPKVEAKPEGRIKSKINRLTIAAIIFSSAIYIAVYVGNVIKVNSLLRDQQRIKIEIDSLHDYAQNLRAKIVSLQSADRITVVAREKLKMSQAQSAPEKLK